MEYSTNHGNFGYWGQVDAEVGHGSQGHQQTHNNHPVPVSNLSSYQSSSGSGAAYPMTPPAGISNSAALNYCANILNEFQMVQQLQQQQVRQGQEIAARPYNTREHHPSAFGSRGTYPHLVLAGKLHQSFQPVNPVHLQPPMGIPGQNVSQATNPTCEDVRSKNRKSRQQKPAPPKRKRGRPRKVKVEMESEEDYIESECNDEEQDDSSVDSTFRKKTLRSKIRKNSTAMTRPTVTANGSNDALGSSNPGPSTSCERVNEMVKSQLLRTTCTLCDQTLLTEGNLQKHMKKVHPDGQVRGKKTLMPRQPKINPNPKYRQIPALETLKKTPEQEEFLKKIIAQVTCTKCTIKFGSKETLLNHVKRHHSKSKGSESEGNIGRCEFSCQICSSTFDERSYLAKHIWSSHYKSKRGWVSSVFYRMRCPFCSEEKSFDQAKMDAFSRHISKHHTKETDFNIIGVHNKNIQGWLVGKTDKKSNYCSQCNFVTTSLVGLAEHFATIHVIPGYSFCKICGIFQADEDSRAEHTLRLHPEVEIGKTNEESLFTDSILLQDVDLQSCDNCDSCFSSTEFLARHKSEGHPKIVDGVRGYEAIVYKLPCFYCENVSKSRTEHQKHMKSAHSHLDVMYQYVRERNIYKCEYCKRYFGQVVKLRRHFYEVHVAQPPVDFDALEVAEQEISNLESELCQAVLATPTIPIGTPETAAISVPVPVGQNVNQGLISEKSEEHDVDYEDPIIIRGKITRKVTFTCYICSETFRLGKELDQHQINCHPEKRDEFPLICGVCHKKYSTINNRRQHIVRTHLTIKPASKINCYLCDALFPTRYDRKKHVMAVHKHDAFVDSPHGAPRPTTPGPEQPPQEWICFICKEKFQTENLLFVHIEKEHPDQYEEGRRVCGICHLKVSTRNVLQRHVKIQHNQTWQRFQCPQCPMSFSRAEGVRNHCKLVHLRIITNKARRNSDVDSLKCKYCDLAFPNVIQKRRHVHTDHPEEALAERREKTMQKMSYEPRWEGEFYCKICSFSYPTESKLIRHVVSAHNRDFKTCEFCWRDISVYFYNKHITRSHSERYYSHTSGTNPVAIPDPLRRLPLRTVLNLISKLQREEEATGNVNNSMGSVKSANKNKVSKWKKKPDSSSSENYSENSGSDSVDSDSKSDSISREKIRSHDNEDDPEAGGSGSDSDESLGLGLNFASDDESKHSDKSEEPKPRSNNSNLIPTPAKSSGKRKLSKSKIKSKKRTNTRKARASKKRSKSWGWNFSSDESSFESESEASISDLSDRDDSEKNNKKIFSLSRKLSSLPAKPSWEKCPKMFNAVVLLTRLPVSLNKGKPTKAEATTSKRRTQKSKSLGLGLNFSSDDSSDFLLQSTEDEDINDSTGEDSFKPPFQGTNRALERRKLGQIKLDIDAAKPDNLRKVAVPSKGQPPKTNPKRNRRRSRATNTRTRKSASLKKLGTETSVANVSKNVVDKGSNSEVDLQHFKVHKVKVEAVEEVDLT